MPRRLAESDPLRAVSSLVAAGIASGPASRVVARRRGHRRRGVLASSPRRPRIVVPASSHRRRGVVASPRAAGRRRQHCRPDVVAAIIAAAATRAGGHEADVGSRTDYRFVSLARECRVAEQLYGEALYDASSTLLLNPHELTLARHLVSNTFGTTLAARVAERLAVLSPSFYTSVARRWLNAYSDDLGRSFAENVMPSTGLLAIALALQSGCASVDLYGFGWSHGTGPRWYYDRNATCPRDFRYDTTRDGVDGGMPYWFPDHDFDFETRLLRDLHDLGVVRLN